MNEKKYVKVRRRSKPRTFDVNAHVRIRVNAADAGKAEDHVHGFDAK